MSLKDRVLRNPVIGPTALTIYFIMFAVGINWIFMQLWLPIILPVIDRAQEMHSQIMTMSMTSETAGICVLLVACLWFASWVYCVAEHMNREER